MPRNTDKINYAIFTDWDNTVISFGAFLIHILEQVAEEMGINPIPKISVPTKTKQDTLLSIFGDRWKEAEPLFDKKYKEQKPQKFNALLGAGELLQKICQAGIPLAVVSNKKTGDIRAELKQQMIDDDITWDSFISMSASKFTIVGSDSVTRPKPDSESGIRALDELGIPYKLEPVRVLHIGDGGMESDMGFAHALNLKLREFNPDSSCESLLFNMYYDEYDAQNPEKLLHTDTELSASDLEYNFIGAGYGAVGLVVRNFLNPGMDTVTKQLNTYGVFSASQKPHQLDVPNDTDISDEAMAESAFGKGCSSRMQ